MAEGARALHLHPWSGGVQTLAAEPCAETLRAVRASCPGVPVSLSTSAAIEADPERRRALVSAWTELPEIVSANQGEEGIRELCEDMLARGVGIEAGLLSVADADPDAAVAHGAAIEAVLDAAGIELDQVHHGDGLASWAVNRRGLERGHGIRTGLEDTTVLPDGRPARDNAELVRAAAELMRG